MHPTDDSTPPPAPEQVDMPPASPPARGVNRTLVMVLAGLVLAVLGIGAVGLGMVNAAREEVAAARSDAAAALEDLEAKRAADDAADDAVAAEQEASEAQEAASEAARQALRQARADAVDDIEDSVKQMAEEHVDDGMIDGPILDVSCSPVAGGSIDDLDEQTTVFDCFVSNEQLDDGRARGYKYNATMNWDTGEYTYGFGDP